MKIDWFTFAAQIVNFGILVYLLNRFLYGPITRAMNQREETIASRLRAADQKQEESEAAQARFQELTESLETKQSELLDEARAQSDAIRQTLIAEVRTEIKSSRDNWHESLHREQNTLIQLVRQKASEQVVEVSRQALTQLADVELEEQTLKMFLKQLSQLPDDQRKQLRHKASQEPIQIRSAFDISDLWQQQIRHALKTDLGTEQVEFSSENDLICGIELHLGGSKIGWSLQDYLESLSDELQGMLVNENHQ